MWDGSLHSDIEEMFDRYAWHRDALDMAFEISAVAYLAAQRERYRTWHRFNRKRANELRAAWRKRNPGRPAEIERKHYQNWKAKRTTEEMRAVWRARKAKTKPAGARIHRCGACGEAGHNARGCENRKAA